MDHAAVYRRSVADRQAHWRTEAGRVEFIPFKPLLNAASWPLQHEVKHVVLVNCGFTPTAMITPQDVDYAWARKPHMDAMVPCEWVESTYLHATPCLPAAPWTTSGHAAGHG